MSKFTDVGKSYLTFEKWLYSWRLLSFFFVCRCSKGWWLQYFSAQSREGHFKRLFIWNKEASSIWHKVAFSLLSPSWESGRLLVIQGIKVLQSWRRKQSNLIRFQMISVISLLFYWLFRRMVVFMAISRSNWRNPFLSLKRRLFLWPGQRFRKPLLKS